MASLFIFSILSGPCFCIDNLARKSVHDFWTFHAPEFSAVFFSNFVVSKIETQRSVHIFIQFAIARRIYICTSPHLMARWSRTVPLCSRFAFKHAIAFPQSKCRFILCSSEIRSRTERAGLFLVSLSEYKQGKVSVDIFSFPLLFDSSNFLRRIIKTKKTKTFSFSRSIRF